MLGLADLGRQHGGAAARADRERPAGDDAREDRGRLADRRGPVDGAGAGAAADPGRRRRWTATARLLVPGAATSGWIDILVTVGLTLAKVAVLVAVMLFAGARFVPWLLIQVSRTGSRELFILAVLAVAFGIAFGSAVIFGVSLALGAFLAGLVVGESDLSHQAAEDALPLRDAFAVLFFVSVGMLFDPSILITSPGHVLAVVAIIVVAKPLVGVPAGGRRWTPGPDGPDRGGRAGADRRVLVHPGRAWAVAGDAARRGVHADPGRRADLDHRSTRCSSRRCGPSRRGWTAGAGERTQAPLVEEPDRPILHESRGAVRVRAGRAVAECGLEREQIRCWWWTRTGR